MKSTSKTSALYWFILIAAILFSFFVRLRLSDMPLERDEGEFAYIAQLILDGESPFDAYNYKIPGVSYMYAFFMTVFGETDTGIRMGVAVVNIISLIFLFLIVKRLINPFTASIAVFVYAFMSLDQGVLGNSAHATHYLNMFVLAGIYVYLKSKEHQDKQKIYLLLSGFFMGMAFIMKQPAALFVLLIILFMVIEFIKTPSYTISKLITNGLLFGAAALMPYGIIVLIAIGFNDFGLFWKWTYVYPKNYVSIIEMKDGWNIFKYMFPHVVNGYKLLWIIGGAGLISTFFLKTGFLKKSIILLFVLCSMTAVIPGYYFRNHYFIIFLPALAFCIGLAFNYLCEAILKRTSQKTGISYVLTGVFFIISISSIAQNKAYFFEKGPEVLSRQIYGRNPFVEAPHISRIIKANTAPGDKIAILGSEAEILFYADRKSATGFLFTYQLVSPNEYSLTLQKQMIREIEQGKPEILLFVGVNTSWSRHPKAPNMIFEWFGNYANTHYQHAGVVDITKNGTIYKYGAEARGYKPQSNQFIHLFKREK
jgi:4-amino-4-deoxy-L-arabinose transferase-like glycosyltransferase